MLKGIFWKPGINGLGVFGFHKLPYAKLFDKAARQHDSDVNWLNDDDNPFGTSKIWCYFNSKK